MLWSMLNVEEGDNDCDDVMRLIIDGPPNSWAFHRHMLPFSSFWALCNILKFLQVSTLFNLHTLRILLVW